MVENSYDLTYVHYPMNDHPGEMNRGDIDFERRMATDLSSMPDAASSHFQNLVRRMEAIQPRLRFSTSEASYIDWRKSAESALLGALGRWPVPTRLDPEWCVMRDGPSYRLWKVRYLCEAGLKSEALMAIPDRPDPKPAVLFLHGHGSCGHLSVLAPWTSKEAKAEHERFGYHLALDLVEEGCIVFAPCLRGFGIRLSAAEKKYQGAGGDACNMNLSHQILLGEVPLTGQLHDLKQALDVLAGHPEVAGGKIGSVGHSLGGRLAMYLAALDLRLNPILISGALNSFVERVTNYGLCGYQIAPGLINDLDVSEILGMAAPRFLMLQTGENDPACPEPHAARLFARIALAYRAAGFPQNLLRVIHPGAHHLVAGASVRPFVEHLRRGIL